jgi:hypothetical protein
LTDPDYRQLISAINNFANSIVASKQLESRDHPATATIEHRGAVQLSRDPLAVPNTLAIVYLAGNGVRVDGIDYFMPVDANFGHSGGSDPEDRRLLIPVDDIVAALKSVAAVQVVIVDACRAEPSGRYSRGQPVAR